MAGPLHPPVIVRPTPYQDIGAGLVLDFAGMRTGGVPHLRRGGLVSRDWAGLGGTCTRSHSGFTSAYAKTRAGLLVPVTADTPRVTDLGALAEGESINIHPSPADLSSGWGTDGVATITTNAATAPDGTMTAAKFAIGTGAYAYSGVSGLNPGDVVTGSLFMKQADAPVGASQLWFSGNGTPNKAVAVNLQTGALVSVSDGLTATIEPFIDGWFRVAATYTLAGGDTGVTLSMICGAGSAGQGFLAWGPKIEERAFATSYHPPGTRGAEGLDISVDLPAEYTVFVEARRKYQGGAGAPVALSFGSTDAILIDDSDGSLNASMGGGSFDAPSGAYGVDGGLCRWAFRAKANDARLAARGGGGVSLSAQDTSFTPTTGATTLYVGSEDGSDDWWNDFAGRVVIDPTGRDDATLTAWVGGAI